MTNAIYQRPMIVGVTEYEDPASHPDIDIMLRDLGFNSGNMMFSASLLRKLQGALPLQYQSVWEGNIEGGDCLVFAAANWLNDFEDFGWAYDVLSQLDIPVVIVGVGAQTTLDYTIPKLKEGTLNFLKLASERSALISTRGEFSSSVLEHYGIKNSQPTGCPSLLLREAKIAGLSGKSGVALHGTRHLYNPSDSELQRYFYSQAFKHSYDILLQSELSDIRIGLLAEHGLDKQALDILKKEYGTSSVEEAVAFVGDKGRFFTTFQDWIDYASSKSLFIGTRIHGTIAAILAGTPAVLVAHDTRTIELARAMSVPYLHGNELDMTDDIDIDAFEALANSSVLDQQYAQYRSGFESFFEKNGLRLV